MQRRVTAALAVLLVVLCAVAAVARPVKIATYNVSNLFDSYDDPYTADVDSYKNGALMVKPEPELKAIAEVLKRLNADVVALEEVENRGFLEEFNSKYLADLGYKEVELIEGNDHRGIDVALLSRFPLGKVSSYRHIDLKVPYSKGPARFSRDLLEVNVAPVGAKPFTVYVAHLKSRSGGKDSRLKREAEARFIRKVLDEKLKSEPKALFVLGGDMNDDASSSTVQILTGKGNLKTAPVTAVAADGTDWTESSRETSKYPPIRFDYLFPSPAMSRLVTGKGILRDLGTAEGFKAEREASDHFPVWMTVNL